MWAGLVPSRYSEGHHPCSGCGALPAPLGSRPHPCSLRSASTQPPLPPLSQISLPGSYRDTCCWVTPPPATLISQNGLIVRPFT